MAAITAALYWYGSQGIIGVAVWLELTKAIPSSRLTLVRPFQIDPTIHHLSPSPICKSTQGTRSGQQVCPNGF